MADKLQVDLIAGNAKTAISEVELFRRSLVQTSATAQALPGLNSLDKQVAALQTRAGIAQRSFQGLFQFDAQNNSLDRISQSSVRLSKETAIVQQRLSEIAAINKAGKTESFLKILGDDALQAERQLVRLEARAQLLKRTNETGGSGFGARPLQGFGGLFRASGATSLGINETEANVALQAISKLGIAAGTLGAIGGIAAAGVAFVAVSEKLAKTADDRLASEERIAGAINKQVRTLREAFVDYEKFKQGLRDVQAFTEKVQDLTKTQSTADIQALKSKADADNKAKIVEINRLQANLATDERIAEIEKKRPVAGNIATELGLGKGFSAADKRQSEALAAEAVERDKKRLAEAQSGLDRGKEKLNELDKALSDVTQNQNKAFDQRFVEFQKNQERETQAQISFFRAVLGKARVTIPELQKTLSEVLRSTLKPQDQSALIGDFQSAILSQINSGRQRVEEFGKSTDELFARLFAKKGPSNPFVAVFTEAQTAIEQARLATAGLTADLAAQAEQLVRTNNANALFSVRLDTALTASDLKASASDFRRQLVPTADDFDKAFQAFADKANNERTQFAQVAGEGGGFAGFTQFKANPFLSFDKDSTFGGTVRRDIRDTLFTAFDQLGTGGTIRRERSFADLSDDEKRNLVRQFSAVSPDQLSAQERLDRQFAIVRAAGPENDQQRAEADRKIIALTQGLKPEDLTTSQRDDAAAAREREAQRLSNAESDAKKQRDDALIVQKSIDANILELLKTAKSDGLQGVIRIINEATDKATDSLGKRRRANDLDSKDLMTP